MDNFDAGIFRFKLFDQFVDQIDFGLIEILPILNDNFFPIGLRRRTNLLPA